MWTSSGASVSIQNAATPSATVSFPSCGVASVQVAVTDDAGKQDVATVVLTPSTVTSDAPMVAGQLACSNTSSDIVIAVCPHSASVQPGGGGVPFTATLGNTTNTAVTWEVDGIVGGSSSVGTVDTSGNYTPPPTSTGATVTVMAVSVADTTKTDSAQVTIASSSASSSGGGIGSGKGGGGALDWLTLPICALLAGSVSSRRRRR